MATLNLGNQKKLRGRSVGAGLTIKQAVVAGALADTDIAVTGLSPGDSLIGVMELQPPTAASGGAILADRANEAKLTAVDVLQLDTTDTTGNQLLVTWIHVE